ncbi:AarF/ABC1/UbiB kinase family protein [Streptomyces luteoverticillatus]|uniref:AarF/ABC1/UbiB kinase family protein n=1 Tax=Streptomyces luteoverticillatus TaxID=66425 RepID=A0A3Q9G1V2_STRLT|nr:AarF/UbiB family protein [Streptomyces luteoverticillatus]AZQ73685.1 AarF/ABC1/UbiB kinase family protein [Streptomyces luteoverticillatus]
MEVSHAALAGRLATVAVVTARHAAAGTLDAVRAGPGGLPEVIGGRAARLLSGLGPTFVKGGQLLSTRHDLLPPRICRSLGRLHDRVPPMTRAQTAESLGRTYGSRRAWPFASFDWTPAASGSIACVYRAELADGRGVAVKVRRPGIQHRMHTDFALLRAGARLMERLPPLREVPARRIVEEVGGAVLGQLDLEREARSLAALRANLSRLPYFRLPAPIPEASGPDALVMDLIEPLDRFQAGRLDREQRRRIVRNVLQGVYRMLFIDGLVHCDMHPGNLYLNPDGVVVLLDAGFVVQLEPPVRRLFAEFFMNMSLGRGPECADVVLRSAERIPPGCDLAGFRSGIEELVAESAGRTAGQFRLAPFATRLFDLQRRSGIAAAPAFVFPLMSLLVLEGMINEFDVDVDFQGEAIPTLLTALNTY